MYNQNVGDRFFGSSANGWRCWSLDRRQRCTAARVPRRMDRTCPWQVDDSHTDEL